MVTVRRVQDTINHHKATSHHQRSAKVFFASFELALIYENSDSLKLQKL